MLGLWSDIPSCGNLDGEFWYLWISNWIQWFWDKNISTIYFWYHYFINNDTTYDNINTAEELQDTTNYAEEKKKRLSKSHFLNLAYDLR